MIPNCKFLFLADDFKLFKSIIKKISDYEHLQKYLHNFYLWCSINNASINVNKCKSITLTHSGAA